MTHLLVTNDFPPKVGGIQAYLWELWRRLDPSTFAVLTASSHPDAPRFDAEQKGLGFRIERVPSRVLLPTPATARHIRTTAHDVGASLVVLDPALPLGLVGASLGGLPYAVVLHGAEVTVPGRLPGSRRALATVLSRSSWRCVPAGIPPPRPGAWQATACRRWWRSRPAWTSIDCTRSPPVPGARPEPRWACPSTARWW